MTNAGPAPVYLQVRDNLRNQILQNRWPSGRLPSETALRQHFAVSRVTIRHALSLLEQEGLIERRHGKGTFVRRPKVHMAIAPFRGFYAAQVQAGTSPHFQLLSLEQVVPDIAIAAEFGLTARRRVQCLTRLYSASPNAPPIALTRTYFRPPIRFTKTQAERRVVYDLLTQVWGEELRQAQYVISATAASTRTAQTLGVMVGYPLLTLKRRTFSTSGVLLEVSVQKLISDLYNLDIMVNNQTMPFREDLLLEGQTVLLKENSP